MFKKSNFILHSFLFFITSICINSQSFADDKNMENFSRGIIVKISGKDYRLAGAADTTNGITDIPGHEWVVDDDELIGRHYNSGPFGASQWWSSSAPDGALLFSVRGIIDDWSLVKATEYYNRGFVHYHELVSMDTGLQHASKVLWLSHAVVGNFNFDRGPHPELSHEVSPGLDYEFIPNWDTPYGEK